MEKEPNLKIQPKELEELNLIKTADLYTQILEAQLLISTLLERIEPYSGHLPLHAELDLACFKQFSRCLENYERAIEEYKKLACLNLDGSEYNLLSSAYIKLIGIIQRSWSTTELDAIKLSTNEFYTQPVRVRDRNSQPIGEIAQSFVSFYEEAYKNLHVITKPEGPIKENVDLFIKDNGNLDEHFSQLYLHCSTIANLFSRRLKTCLMFKYYLSKDKLLACIETRRKTIQAEIEHHNGLKEYFVSNTTFNLVTLKSLMDSTPVGSWCSKMYEGKERLIKLFRDELLASLFEKDTYYRVQNKNTYNQLNDERLNILLENLDKFLFEGDFLSVDAIILLEILVPDHQDKLEQYKAECEWYCKIVLSNIKFIEKLFGRLSQIRQLDTDDTSAPIIIKKLILLFSLVIDQLQDNKDLDIERSKAIDYILIFTDYIRDLENILDENQMLTVVTNTLQ